MAKELAFVLINPYTIRKSRTGGVIAHIISRVALDLVAARMFGPSRELVEKYAALVREEEKEEGRDEHILSEYVLRAYMPDSATGKRQRVLMLLFEGQDAIRKVREATGNIQYNLDSARTLRDIYGDYIMGADGKVMYVEPAVLIGPDKNSTRNSLKLWAEYSPRDGGIIEEAHDLPASRQMQKTLVLIKPDNFRFPSARPGKIINLFSGSGLRIIGAKIHCMSIAEAEEFYGPVKKVLQNKLKGKVGELAAKVLSKELNIQLSPEVQEQLGDILGPAYGEHQFYEIIQYMTGHWAPDCPVLRTAPGKERCLALVYAGKDAVNRIRGILGPTDPSKAEPGSVRREFGQDILENAAHASDSEENAAREMKLIHVEEDLVKPLIDKYYP